MYRSLDNGDTWELVGGGSQLWRAIGIICRPEALYWGTDAGSDAGTHPNYVMRWDRASGRLDKVVELQGPCHGVASLEDGTLLVSTGIEGGENEKDCFAHVWVCANGQSWDEVARFRKDFWPHVVQYGVVRFPWGLESGRQVVFTGMGLTGAAEMVVTGHLIIDQNCPK